MRRVVFPVDASTLSAWGILHSDLGHDFARSRVLPAEAASLPAIRAMAEDLVATGHERLAQDGIAEGDRELAFSADLRYRGQAFELTVPWRVSAPEAADLERLVADFHDAHRQRFSYSNPGDAVELVTLRLAAIGRLDRPPTRKPSSGARAAAQAGTRRVWIDGAWRDAAVWKREDLAPGQACSGPAIVEEAYTTALVVPGWSVAATAEGHLVATRD
jgi:N-methylhydantoinase A